MNFQHIQNYVNYFKYSDGNIVFLKESNQVQVSITAPEWMQPRSIGITKISCLYKLKGLTI